MIYYFFVNSYPVYEKESVDKPYYYSEDPEEAAKMILRVIVKRSVLAFQNKPNLKQTMICEGDISFDMIRENVKKMKEGLDWRKDSKCTIWAMDVKV